MKKIMVAVLIAILTTTILAGSSYAQQCGSQVGGALCGNGLCCSKYGYCGTTSDYCCAGCQSQCNCGGGSSGVGSIITSSMFDQMLLHRNDAACQGRSFYTYDAFITTARAFSDFGTTGDVDTRKREIAAFLAQTSKETTGGWPTAPDGPYSWGYCFKVERDPPNDYCSPNPQWPCAPGKTYVGRGPIQLSHNYNYGPAGQALNYDLLNNPDLVAADPIVSFKTALWFWTTPQSPKPSCHDVITGRWTPSAADSAAGRLPGYGLITNIINGGKECAHRNDARVQDRIGFYRRYCDLLGVSYGDNLDCGSQTPYE